MSTFKPYFMDFMQQLYSKMETGHSTYGDKSFNISHIDGIAEIQSELVDVCGWSLVEWIKLERLKMALVKSPIVSTEKVASDRSTWADLSTPAIHKAQPNPKDKLSEAAKHLLKGIWPCGTLTDTAGDKYIALDELVNNGYVEAQPNPNPKDKEFTWWLLTKKGFAWRQSGK